MITNVASCSHRHASSSLAGARPRIAGEGTSDLDLIARIAAGNRLAMQALYARHSARVFRFALRLIASRPEAEDVVSDVFLDVWRRAGTFEGRAQVSTWLLGITRNKALDARKRRVCDHCDEDAASAVVDPASNPEADIERRDRSAVIRRCVMQLSPEHREVIDLVYYNDRSIDDVAKTTGVPHATVKTRMFHARKRLGAVLHEQGITTAA